jgi:hypothetical protein
MIALLLFTVYSFSIKITEPSLLLGNWYVVSDSSLNTNKLYTLSAGDSGIGSSNYIGEQCGATFNFYSNGNLVTSFFNCSFAYPSVDSAKYVLEGNQVTISIFAQNSGCCSFTYLTSVIKRTYLISNLTANTATLTFKSVHPLPSEGELAMKTEIINLEK